MMSDIQTMMWIMFVCGVTAGIFLSNILDQLEGDKNE